MSQYQHNLRVLRYDCANQILHVNNEIISETQSEITFSK